MHRCPEYSWSLPKRVFFFDFQEYEFICFYSVSVISVNRYLFFTQLEYSHKLWSWTLRMMGNTVVNNSNKSNERDAVCVRFICLYVSSHFHKLSATCELAAGAQFSDVCCTCERARSRHYPDLSFLTLSGARVWKRLQFGVRNLNSTRAATESRQTAAVATRVDLNAGIRPVSECVCITVQDDSFSRSLPVSHYS